MKTERLGALLQGNAPSLSIFYRFATLRRRGSNRFRNQAAFERFRFLCLIKKGGAPEKNSPARRRTRIKEEVGQIIQTPSNAFSSGSR